MHGKMICNICVFSIPVRPLKMNCIGISGFFKVFLLIIELKHTVGTAPPPPSPCVRAWYTCRFCLVRLTHDCFFFKETTLYGVTAKVHEPVGVIAVACPDAFPLLGFVSLFAPAVVRGNTVVVVPSEAHPLLALDLYQVSLTFTNLTLNHVAYGKEKMIYITGVRHFWFARRSGQYLVGWPRSPDEISRWAPGCSSHVVQNCVALPQNVGEVNSRRNNVFNLLRYFGSAEGSKFVEFASAENVKRTWVNYGCVQRITTCYNIIIVWHFVFIFYLEWSVIGWTCSRDREKNFSTIPFKLRTSGFQSETFLRIRYHLKLKQDLIISMVL